MSAWRSSAPRLPLGDRTEALPQVPPTVAAAEEAHLVWRWLTSPGVQVVEATGPLCLPSQPVPEAEDLVAI